MATINIGADVSPAGLSAFDRAIMGAATPTTGGGIGGFFDNLGNLGTSIGNFLGGAGGSLIGAGLSIDELNSLRDVAQQASTGMAEIGQRGAEAAAFRPFTVSTGFGGVSTTPEGGFATTLDPQQAAQQQQQQAPPKPLAGAPEKLTINQCLYLILQKGKGLFFKQGIRSVANALFLLNNLFATRNLSLKIGDVIL